MFLILSPGRPHGAPQIHQLPLHLFPGDCQTAGSDSGQFAFPDTNQGYFVACARGGDSLPEQFAFSGVDESMRGKDLRQSGKGSSRREQESAGENPVAAQVQSGGDFSYGFRGAARGCLHASLDDLLRFGQIQCLGSVVRLSRNITFNQFDAAAIQNRGRGGRTSKGD